MQAPQQNSEAPRSSAARYLKRNSAKLCSATPRLRRILLSPSLKQQAARHSAKEKGYVALLAVLIVSVLGVALAASLLYRSGLQANTTEILERSFRARNFADACADQALHVITQNESYSGSDTMSFDTGSCEYEVQAAGSESIVQSTGHAGEATRRVRVDAETIIAVGEFGTTTEIVSADWTEPVQF